MKYLIVIIVLINFSCNKQEEHNIDYYKQIFNLKHLNYKQIESFIVIEENQQSKKSNRVGVVICNTDNRTEIFTYSINLEKENSLKLSDDYDSETSPHYDQRMFLFQLALTNFKIFHELEKINPNKVGNINYIIAYNDKSKYSSMKTINLYDVKIK